MRRDLLLEHMGQATFRFGGGDDGLQSGVEVLIPLYQSDGGMLFFYPKGTLGDGMATSFSLGLGYRHLLDEMGLILGGNVFFDHTETRNGSQINQAGLGVELLSKWVDARANVYLPSTHTNLYDTQKTRLVSSRTASQLLSQRVSGASGNGAFGFRDNNLVFGGGETVSVFRDTTTRTIRSMTVEQREAGMTGMDAELGVLLPWVDRFADVRLFGGYYYYDNPFGSDIDGFKGRLEIRVVPAITLDAEYYSDDRLIGSHWYAGVRFNVPFELANLNRGVSPFDGFTESFRRPSEVDRSVAARMDENIMRQSSARTSDSGFTVGKTNVRRTQSNSKRTEREEDSEPVVLTAGGDAITIDHVNSDGQRGKGTINDPHGRLALVADSKSDIVYIHADSVFRNETLTLGGTARILGEGGGRTYQVETDQFGLINLPRATNGNRLPQFFGGGRDGAIVLKPNSKNLEISGLTLDGGTRGIAGLSGARDTRITNMNIRNMTGAGIEITPSTRTTIEGVTFSNNGTDTILNAESTVYRDIVSKGSRIGLDLRNTTGKTIIEDYKFKGSGGSLFGIRITNPRRGKIKMDDIKILGRDRTVTGIGIIRGRSSKISLFDTKISDTTGSGLSIFGGRTRLNLNRVLFDIDQGAVLTVDGGHTGTFRSRNTTFRVDGGTGFNFADADGAYTFSNPIQLNGVTRGLVINPNSRGSFIFQDFGVSGTSLTGNAIELGGSLANSVRFGNVTVSNLGGFDAVNLQSSNTFVAMNSLNVFGTGAAGSTAVDYRGASGFFDVSGGTIQNVIIGYNLGAPTSGRLNYRNANVSAGIPVNAVGLLAGAGPFDFTGTAFFKDNSLATATGFGNSFIFADGTGGGTGTSTSRVTIDAAETMSLPEDIIVLVDNGTALTSTDGVNLQDDQQLIGFATGSASADFTAQAAALNIIGNFNYLIADPTGNGAATLQNGAGTASLIELADGNIVRGFDLLSTATTAVNGNGITGATVADLTFLAGGTGDGFNFSNTAGTIAVTNSDVTNITGDAVTIDGGSNTINIASDININNAGAAVLVQNRAGGAINFSGTIQATGSSSGIDISGSTAVNAITFSNDVDLGTAANRLTGSLGLDIDNNGIAGAQVSFTDTLNIFTDGQDGVTAVNGGTLRIDAGVLNAQGAGADGVVLNGITSDVALASVNVGDATSVGAASNGIILTNVNGSFDVSGATTLGSAATDIGSGIVINGGDVDTGFGAVTIGGRNGVGIGVDATTGTHSFGLTTMTNDNNDAASSISITNLTGGTVAFANAAHNIDQGAGSGPALLLDNNSVGFSFTGGTIQSSGGAVVEIEDAQGAITFNSATLTQNGTGLLLDIHDVTGGNNILFSSTGSMSATGAAGGTRIALTNNAANITIADATIASGAAATDAVTVSGGSGQVNLSNVDITAAGQDGVDVSNFAGDFQFQQGGTISNTGANGILVSGAGATATNVFVIGDDTINTFDTIGADAINISGISGTVGITDVNATAVTGDVFDLTTTGTVTVEDGLTLAQLAGGRMINQTGTHTINDATFSNLIINGGDSTINMTGSTTVTGANAGPLLSIVNGAAGTVNFNGSGGVNQSNAANTGIIIDGSSTAVNFNTPVTLTGGGGGILVQNGATSSVAFNNVVTISSGANTAIAMTSTGLLDFNGALTVNTTTGTGIDVTAGTLNTVSGTVTSTAGRAINLDSMTADVNLTGISSSGSATQGVRLNNVSGDFDVTGTTTVNGSTNDGILVSGSSADVSFASVDIDNAGGDGINLQNDTGTIQISGGTIDGGAADGIDITNTSVTVSGLNIGGTSAVGNAGIRVATTGTARSVSLNNNSIHSTSHGIVTSDSGAISELSLVLNGNTIETDNSSSLAMNIVGGGAGNSTVINGFNGVTVIGNGAGGGILFDNVMFDAVTGGGIQQVAGGVAQIGQNAGARVDGAGLALNNARGNLAFTTVNIFNDSGIGLNVDSTPGTFTLANAGGSIDTTNSGAVSIVDTTLGTTSFANITSTNGANGILLSNVTGGSFGVTGTASVSGATDTAVEIVNSATPVTIATAALTGVNGLSITGGTSAGTLNVNGGTITSNSAAGTGVLVSGTSANITFAGTDVSQVAAGRIVQVDNTTAGTVLFNTAGSIAGTAAGNIGVQIAGNAGAVNLNNVTVANAAATAISMTNNSGSTRVGNVNIDGGTTGINLADNTALATVEGGTIDGTSANGIDIANSLALIDTVNLGTSTLIGGDGITVTKSNANSDTVDITVVNIAAAGGRGIFVNNTGAGTQTVNISSTSAATAGHGIEVVKSGAGSIRFSLGNSSLISTAGSGLTLNGTGGAGTLVVTGLADNAITAAATAGAIFETVTFDSDLGTVGDQAVSGGGSSISASGAGLRLNNVTGGLDFDSISIGNSGGTGLFVREAGAFTFGANTLNITTIGGAAIDADNDFDVAAGVVSSINSPAAGVALNVATGTLSLTSLSVTNAATTAVEISNNLANITLGSLAINGSGNTGTGVDVDANSGTITVTGATNIDDVTGTAIDLGGAGGGVTFGNVDIDGAANAINLEGATGTYVFGNIDVANVTGVGLDFEDSNLIFTAASFDMNGGTTAIDLTGSQNPLGANSANTNIRITNGGAIQNVSRGVDLSNTDLPADSAGANFVFGGGSIQATTYTVDAFGLVTVNPFNQGRYDFTGVSFTGPVGFSPAVVGTIYYVAANATGAGNGSSVNDRMTLANANAVADPSAVFVFINDGNVLDLGAASFTLASGQQINGFGNGNEFGLVQPVNVIGNFGSIAVTDPTGNGAATLTGTSTLLDFAGNNSIQNIDINGGATTFLANSATGTITIVDNSVTQNGGRLLTIDGGNVNFSLSAGVNTITGTGGTGISVVNTTGGSVSINGAQITNASATPLTFDNNDATFNITNSTISTAAGVTLLDVDNTTGGSTGALTVNGTNTLTHTTGTIANIGAGSRDINLGAHNFSETTGSTQVAVNITGQSGGSISFGNITRNNSTASNVINVTGQTNGALSFGNVSIGGYGNGGGDLAVSLQGTGGSVTFSDLDIVATDGAGLSAGAITLNPGTAASISATGGTALTLNGTTLAAGSTFTSVASANAGAGNEGIDIDNTSGTLTITSVDIDNAGTVGVDIAGTTGTLNIGTADIDGGATGISLATTSGAQVNFGNVTIDNVTGTAINMANSDGTITFDDVAINVAANGIDLTGADGDYTFEDIDLTGVTGTGLDFEDSDLEFFASSFDMNGGMTAIDLTGTTNPLGQNSANINIEIDNGGVITGVARGIDLSNTDAAADSAGAYFVFGGGSITASTYTVDAFGLVNNNGFDRGRYDFSGVTFTGPVGFASSTTGTVYYVTETGSGTGTGGSIANSMSIIAADALADATAVFVLVNNPGNDPINISNTFSLAAGQQFNGFGNGNVFGLVQPVNVIGNFGSISVTDPNGAATLEASGAFDLIQIAGNNEIRNIKLNLGTNTVVGNGFSNFTLTGTSITNTSAAGSIFNFTGAGGTVSLSAAGSDGITIAQTGGRLLNLVGGNSVFSLNASGGVITNSGGTGLRISGTTGGSVALNGIQIAGATSTPLTFDSNAATVSFTNNSVATVAGVTLLNVDATSASTTALTFNNTNTFTHGSGTIAVIGGGARNIDLSAHNFTSASSSVVAVDIIGQTGGTISFGNITRNGSTAANVIATNAHTGGSLVFGNVAISGFGDGGVDLAVNLNGLIGAGAVTFGDLDITTTNGSGLRTNNITFNPGATSNISATSGAALNMLNTNVAGNFVNVSSNGAAAEGISLTNITGTFGISGTAAISNAGTNGISISGSSASVSLASVAISDSTLSGIRLANNTGGVQILGGTINGGVDGVSVLNSNFVVDNVNIGGTTAVGGIGVDVSATSGTRTAAITDSTIRSAGHGINVGDTGGVAGRLSVAVDSTTTQSTGAGSLGARFVGSGLNSLTINSFAGNTVTANGTGGGILFDRVTFDATTGGTVQQVGTGTLQVGQGIAAAQRVEGNGVSFVNTTGDLAFNTFNVFNKNGIGLNIDTTGLGTSFTMATSGGTVNTSTGAAIFADTVTMNGTLANAISSGSTTNGVTLDTVGGNMAFTNISVTGATGAGLLVQNNASTHSFGTVSVDGAATGVQIASNTGTLNFTGLADIDSITGAAVHLANAGGGVNFADISITTAATGINLNSATGTYVFGDVAMASVTTGIGLDAAAGTYTFGDIDITGLSGVGLDFEDSNVLFTANSLDVTGTGSNAVAIDLTRTANPNGANSGTTNIDIVNGGNISAVSRGVDLSNTNLPADSAGASFRFGGGSIAATTWTIDAIGLVSTNPTTQGNYNFTNTTFTGNFGFSSSAGSLLFVGDAATGAGDGSSLSDLAAPATADANTNASTVFVMVNTGSNIDVGGGFSLANSQQINGFGNGNTFSLNRPVNITGLNIPGAVGLSHAGGAATVTGAGTILTLANSNAVQNIAFSGGTTTISGTNINNFTLTGTNLSGGSTTMFNFTGPSGTINITNNTITQTGGRLLDLNGGIANFSLSAGTGSILNSAGDGIRVQNTTGGSVTLTGLQITNAGSTPLVLGNNDAAISFTGNTVGTAANQTLLEVDVAGASTTNLVFDNSNTFNHTSGMIADIRAGGRNVDLSAHSFANTGSVAANVINNVDQTGGTISFGSIAITGYNNSAGTAVNLQGTAGTVNFGDLDITTAAGSGLNTGGIAFAPGSSASINTTGGFGLAMSGTSLGAGATFTSIQTSSPASNVDAISISNITGTLNIGSATVSGVSGATGDAISLTGGGAINFGNVDLDNNATGLNIGSFSGTAMFAQTGGQSFTLDGGLTGIVLSGNTGTINIANADIGGTTVQSVAGILILGGTANIDITGSVRTNSTSSGISVNNLGATATVDITNGAGTAVNVIGGRSIDIGSGNSAASQITFGNVTVANTTNAGLELDGSEGIITFGNVTIGSPTGVGINLNAATGDYTFGNVSITFSGAGRGIDFRDSILDLDTNNLSITGNGVAGSIAMDLSGSQNANGNNSTNSNIRLGDGVGQTALINNVATGVKLGDATDGSAGAYLVYGNQVMLTSGSQINVAAGAGNFTIDTTNLTSTNPFTQGRYEFAGVTYTGKASFESAGAFYVGSVATGNGSGSDVNNLATYTDAEGQPAGARIVLVSRPGATTLNLNAGNPTWNLLNTQEVLGFGNGATITVNAQPVNVIGSFQTVISDPFGQGALTVNGLPGSNVFSLGSGNIISNFNVTGGLNSFSGTATNGLTMNGMAISGASGSAFNFIGATGTIDINSNTGSIGGANIATILGGSATYTFDRSAAGSFASANGGFSITNTTGGSFALTGGASLAGSSGSMVTLGNNVATVNLAALNVTGTGSNLFNIDAGADSTGAITFTGTGVLTGGRAFDVDGGSRAITASGFSFTSNNANTNPVVEITNVAGGTISFGNIAINNFGTGASQTAVAISGGSAGTFTFADLDIAAVNGSALVISELLAGTGTFNVSSGTISATNGQALSATNLSLGTLFLSSVTSTNSTSDAIAFSGTTGNPTLLSVAVTGVANQALDFASHTGGLITVSSGSIAKGATAGELVLITSAPAAITLTSATKSGGTGDGISIATSTGTKNFGALNITTTDGDAVVASNAGTLQATSGTLSAIGVSISKGAALDISGTTALSLALTSVSSDNSQDNGIRLSGAGVSGTVTAGITSLTDALSSAVSLTNTSATVTLNSTLISGNAGHAVNVTGGAPNLTVNVDTGTAGAGIQTNAGVRILNVDSTTGGAVSLNGGTGSITGEITNTSGGGIRLNNANSAVTVTNFRVITPTGIGVDIDGGTNAAVYTFEGDIQLTQGASSANAALDIFGTAATINWNLGTITAHDNSGARGGTRAININGNNVVGGVYNFTDLDITAGDSTLANNIVAGGEVVRIVNLNGAQFVYGSLNRGTQVQKGLWSIWDPFNTDVASPAVGAITLSGNNGSSFLFEGAIQVNDSNFAAGANGQGAGLVIIDGATAASSYRFRTREDSDTAAIGLSYFRMANGSAARIVGTSNTQRLLLDLNLNEFSSKNPVGIGLELTNVDPYLTGAETGAAFPANHALRLATFNSEGGTTGLSEINVGGSTTIGGAQSPANTGL